MASANARNNSSACFHVFFHSSQFMNDVVLPSVVSMFCIIILCFMGKSNVKIDADFTVDFTSQMKRWRIVYFHTMRHSCLLFCFSKRAFTNLFYFYCDLILLASGFYCDRRLSGLLSLDHTLGRNGCYFLPGRSVLNLLL